MKRLCVLIVAVALACGLSVGCGKSPGGPTGGHIKLSEEQMQQAKEAQMKAMMQQKGGMKK